MAFIIKFSDFISKCFEDPAILSDPALRFFRDFIASLGGAVPDVAPDMINPWWAEFNCSSIKCPVTGEIILDPIFLPDGNETKYLTYFTEHSFIAHGGFGFVAKCNNKLDQQIYAVKKVPLKYAEKNFDKVLREVRAISSLNHPNIVRYYQAWIEPQLSGLYCNEGEEGDEHGDLVLTKEEIDGPCLYLLMEYCPRTLSQWLKDSDPLEDPETRENKMKIFQQIVSAVAHIHKCGFLHGDLSIGNILMDENGNVKVADLGQCRKIDDEGHVYMSDDDGNRLYKPPESGQGAILDTKADIYCLGLILGELLHPFETDMGRVQVLERCKNGEFPTEWDDVDGPTLRQLTSLEPETRPTSAMLLVFENFF